MRRIFLLAALLASAACRKPLDVPSIQTLDEILGRPGSPSVELEGSSWRSVEDKPTLQVGYAEISNDVPMAYNNYTAMSLIVVEGEMEIRLGREQRVAGPGAYVYVPKQMPFLIRRRGVKKLVVACVYVSYKRIAWTRLQAPLAVEK